jgi:PilZ domain
VDVPVHDISEEGARIGVAENLKVNDVIALTFAGMNAIAGKIVRDGGDSFGVWFTPFASAAGGIARPGDDAATSRLI